MERRQLIQTLKDNADNAPRGRKQIARSYLKQGRLIDECYPECFVVLFCLAKMIEEQEYRINL